MKVQDVNFEDSRNSDEANAGNTGGGGGGGGGGGSAGTPGGGANNRGLFTFQLFVYFTDKCLLFCLYTIHGCQLVIARF